PCRSWAHHKSEIKSPEHQDNANIHDQPFPESVSQERKIHADDHGNHRHHIDRDNNSSVHFGSSTGFKPAWPGKTPPPLTASFIAAFSISITSPI
ncbi:MAG: hypothetical protein WAM62_07710, partial [Pseudolabrys sp.]